MNFCYTGWRSFGSRTLISLGLAIVLSGCSRRDAALGQNSTKSAEEQLAQQMIGTWVHVGSPGRVRGIPESGGRFKLRDGDHWNLTVVEEESGLVTENFGGTYTLKGDEYIETQHYATPQWLHDNEKSFKFKVMVEGDTMTQFGLDNPFTEVWKRVRATQPGTNNVAK